MKKITGSILAAAVVGAFTVACAANTDATAAADDKSAEGSKAIEKVNSELGAFDSCINFAPSAVTSTYVNQSQPYCEGANLKSSGTSYGTSSCSYFVAEWDGTTVNSGGAFTAIPILANSIRDAATCNNTTVDLSVYGFEDSTNPALYGIPGWIGITSLTSHGAWNGTSCVFSPGDVWGGPAPVTFNDAVNPLPPHVVPRYLDIRIAVQAYTQTTTKGTTSYSYLPVSIDLASAGCTY